MTVLESAHHEDSETGFVFNLKQVGAASESSSSRGGFERNKMV